MENTYNYVFWYNYFEELWYAISRDEYSQFFNDKKKVAGALASKKIDTLIGIINNPKLVKKSDK